MQDLEKLREIEELGLEDPPPAPEEPEGGGLSGAPLVQAALCLLALVALVVLRSMDAPVYREFAAWYQQEAAGEIQLPAWEGADPEPSPTAAPTPTPAPTPAPWEGETALQRV